MNKHGIPTEFYNEKKAGILHPTVCNVGELMKQLERLPNDLLICGKFTGEDVRLVVYNINDDRHLRIESFDDF